jgi:hypothetical protein
VKGLGEALEYVIQVLERRCCMMSATNSLPIETTIYHAIIRALSLSRAGSSLGLYFLVGE